MSALYDRIGRSYVTARGEDPRIAAAIHAQLVNARTVLNVGAGAGSYEPRDRVVTAVEPSAVMRAQRPPGAAPFQWGPAFAGAFWLTRDHSAPPDGSSPAYGLASFPGPQRVTLAQTAAALGVTRSVPVPIPHDCRDGFLMAYWRRPEAYLDPVVRANISVFSLLPEAEVEAMVASLRADLESGAWARRNAQLLELDELDLGFRVLVAE